MNRDILSSIPNPIEIIEGLDKYVIGQKQAKKSLALMLVDRALRLLVQEGVLTTSIPLQKSNLLLIGPTGVGKTSLVKALSKVADVPITVGDVTPWTTAGYIGGKVEDILSEHLQNVNDYLIKAGELFWFGEGDNPASLENLIVEVAEYGIIYLDEIDKLGTSEKYEDSTHGFTIQNELLKFLEGANIVFDKRQLDRIGKTSMTLKTDNITFIMGGAFVKLADIIEHRLVKKCGIGFTTDLSIKIKKELDPSLLLLHATTEDLIKYGFKPEFLGRIQKITTLHSLDEISMTNILTNAENSIYKQYVQKFKLLGVDLKIEKPAIKQIVREAIKLKLGARALSRIIDKVIEPEYFNLFKSNKNKIVITESIIKRNYIE